MKARNAWALVACALVFGATPHAVGQEAAPSLAPEACTQVFEAAGLGAWSPSSGIIDEGSGWRFATVPESAIVCQGNDPDLRGIWVPICEGPAGGGGWVCHWENWPPGYSSENGSTAGYSPKASLQIGRFADPGEASGAAVDMRNAAESFDSEAVWRVGYSGSSAPRDLGPPAVTECSGIAVDECVVIEFVRYPEIPMASTEEFPQAQLEAEQLHLEEEYQYYAVVVTRDRYAAVVGVSNKGMNLFDPWFGQDEVGTALAAAVAGYLNALVAADAGGGDGSTTSGPDTPSSTTTTSGGDGVWVTSVEVDRDMWGDDADAYQQITLTRAGVTRPLQPYDVLRPDDRIGTGAGVSAVLQTGDGHTITIDELSDITVQGAVNLDVASVLWIAAGEISASVRNTQPVRSDFEVRSPTATASVRGTRFTVSVPDPTTTVVAVSEGAVAVDPVVEGLPTVDVVAGEQVTVTDHDLTRPDGQVVLPGDESSPLPLILGAGGAALMLLLGAVLLARRSRRRREGVPTSRPASPLPPPPPPPPPAPEI